MSFLYRRCGFVQIATYIWGLVRVHWNIHAIQMLMRFLPLHGDEMEHAQFVSLDSEWAGQGFGKHEPNPKIKHDLWYSMCK